MSRITRMQLKRSRRRRLLLEGEVAPSTSHTLLVAQTSSFYGYYANGSSGGVVTPGTFEGLNVYHMYVVQGGATANRCRLGFGATGTTQVPGVTTINWTFGALTVACAWNGTIYEAIDTDFRTAIVAELGNTINVNLEAL